MTWDTQAAFAVGAEPCRPVCDLLASLLAEARAGHVGGRPMKSLADIAAEMRAAGVVEVEFSEPMNMAGDREVIRVVLSRDYIEPPAAPVQQHPDPDVDAHIQRKLDEEAQEKAEAHDRARADRLAYAASEGFTDE